MGLKSISWMLERRTDCDAIDVYLNVGGDNTYSVYYIFSVLHVICVQSAIRSDMQSQFE
jgi:hypothetical protein